MQQHIARHLTDLIGNTPLLHLKRFSDAMGIKADIIAKLEYFNPGGSVKDRVAFSMITEAERSGVLRPGGVIVEPTSGNTGVGLAWIGSSKGYKVILTMPDTMSKERRELLKAYGAQIVLTPGADGMAGAIARAEEIRISTPGAIVLGQFTNPANPAAHEATTGPEIWNATKGKVDIFISGVGTGGTITGTGRYLKSRNRNVRIVAVEPRESAVLSGENPGPHGIQGIGAGFTPVIYDPSVVDEIVTVYTDYARTMTRQIARQEGLLVGISSGAALAAALEIGRRPESEGKTIVALLPDTGERYLSTGVYD
ncbi:cysteine synthase A [Paramuribaculum intestinale]|uniref:Cysteine synthase n=3 Tax=Paramuribaculum intestinale TaxID=2094151 RepID=A0A2V1J384_9BACT|nr:cysteine synthase A [Paramuribaculum intestinale]MBJ2186553.1 cysteine synthase A [Muribaculaceae bacterium]ROS94033.1 cysteine synthase A [Muribaculaceae bacterium Isolate-043 (Harlan)]MCX4329051.1 cysteine synthase A [Paramuribaculum intestinale]PWB09832.1 cysteine synthase A [Paramuribaculum intestinale]PWB12897.1 cysteine synthase A [Paramuribaculum intestinale]